MELKEVKLKPMQEIQSINVEPADNGGCVLRYTIYTPGSKHSDSVWDSRVELFDDDKVDEALDRIKELYRLNLESKKKPTSEKGYEDIVSKY